MKIRTGFVSNSSSSSFILLFAKYPKSEEQLMNMMFPNEDPDGTFSGSDYYDSMSYKNIIIRVFKDIQDPKARSTASLKEEIESELHHEVYNRSRSNFRLFFTESSFITKHIPEKEFSEYVEINIEEEKITDEVFKLSKELEMLIPKRENEYRSLDFRPSRFKTLGRIFLSVKNSLLNLKHKDDTVRALAQYRVLSKITDKQASIELKKMFGVYKEYDDVRTLRQKLWTKGKEILQEVTENTTQSFLENHKGKTIRVVSYADENGEGLLEHGGIFDNIEHYIISHH